MVIYDFFLTEPTAFAIACGILGLIVGSFLNVVIYRLPIMMERDWKQQCEEFLANDEDAALTQQSNERFDLLLPRSRCSSCQHPIAAWDNIPVLSYVLLGGKCRNCKAPVSFRYPFVELLTAAASIAVAIHFDFTVQTLFALILTWSLIALIFIDYDTQLLPDNFTLPLLWLGITVNYFEIHTSLADSVVGAVQALIEIRNLRIQGTGVAGLSQLTLQGVDPSVGGVQLLGEVVDLCIQRTGITGLCQLILQRIDLPIGGT